MTVGVCIGAHVGAQLRIAPRAALAARGPARGALAHSSRLALLYLLVIQHLRIQLQLLQMWHEFAARPCC